MLKKNDTLQLEIIDMTSEGFGVARYSDEDLSNFVIFVKDSAVGDVINAKIVKVLSSYGFAIITDFVKESEFRKEPVCAVYNTCGGCSFSHITYEKELEIKRGFVQDAFKKNYRKNVCDIEKVIPSPSEYNYRNKAQMPFSVNGKCGYFAKHSHRVTEVSDCVLNDADFAYIADAVEGFIQKFNIPVYNEKNGSGLVRHLVLRKAPSTGEIMVCLVINGNDLPHKAQLVDILSRQANIKSIYLNINTQNTNVIMSSKCRLIWGYETIYDKLCGLKFGISPFSFYQINSPQTENLYGYAKKIADLNENDVILDLYCGIGTIGLTMADKVKKVYGIEIIPAAIKDAEKNAEFNGITNAEFFISDAADAEDIINSFDERPNVIIVDPPRKGLDENTVNTIKKCKPEKLIYISCNPSTLARDLAMINDSDDYEIRSIQPFDMFPKTTHVETVVLLTRTIK